MDSKNFFSIAINKLLSNASKGFELLLHEESPDDSLSVSSFASRDDEESNRVVAVSRRVRVVGAAGERLVTLSGFVATLGNLVEAYADGCGVEDDDAHAELTQGFRLIDATRRVVQFATIVEFRGHLFDWEGCTRTRVAPTALRVIDFGSEPYLFIMGSYSFDCDAVFYGEVESSRADAVETATGLPAVLMMRATSGQSQILSESVLCNQVERRQLKFLDDAEARRLLSLYDVTPPRERSALVAVLGKQEPLTIVPSPSSFCDFDAFPRPIRESLRESQRKSCASIRRILPRSSEDVARTLETCEPGHLKWLRYDERFKEADAWQTKFLMAEVGRLAWNDTLRASRLRDSSKEKSREEEQRLEFLKDRSHTEARVVEISRARTVRQLRERRVLECPEGGKLLGWRIVRRARAVAMLVRDTELDVCEGDVSASVDVSDFANKIVECLR